MKTKQELLKAKRKVKEIFPQWTRRKFILWYPQGTIGEVYCIQEYVGSGKSKELFSNVYYMDLELKSFCN